jgi:protein-disulfide isomerase
MRKMWNLAVRLGVFGGLAIMLLAGASPFGPLAHAQNAAPRAEAVFSDIKINPDDHVMGRADAPVTIVEYASLTCPHCANFHNNSLPQLKKAYIDTGKVRLVYRDFPLDRLALAGSMLARCFGRDRYLDFVGILFEDQRRWARSSNPMKSLGQIARLGGMSTDQFESCFKDKKIQTAILEQRLQGTKIFQVNSTPTLIINGRKFSSALSFAQLKSIIDPMLSNP